jgi:hypothetical protein
MCKREDVGAGRGEENEAHASMTGIRGKMRGGKKEKGNQEGIKVKRKRGEKEEGRRGGKGEKEGGRGEGGRIG